MFDRYVTATSQLINFHPFSTERNYKETLRHEWRKLLLEMILVSVVEGITKQVLTGNLACIDFGQHLCLYVQIYYVALIQSR